MALRVIIRFCHSLRYSQLFLRTQSILGFVLHIWPFKTARQGQSYQDLPQEKKVKPTS